VTALLNTFNLVARLEFQRRHLNFKEDVKALVLEPPNKLGNFLHSLTNNSMKFALKKMIKGGPIRA
jgi:hypothetical protein